MRAFLFVVQVVLSIALACLKIISSTDVSQSLNSKLIVGSCAWSLRVHSVLFGSHMALVLCMMIPIFEEPTIVQ